MYKVLIVDDEPIMRKGLLCFVNWEALNCFVAGDISNGLEAKEYIVSNQVDIVIADIRMPGMDGLQLAKWICENFPRIKVIILTAFADFTYAQAAIKYGVVEFVTKTNPAEEIPTAILNAQKLITLDHEKDKQIEILEDKIDANRALLQEKFVKDVLDRVVIDKDAINQQFSEFGFFGSSYIFVLYQIILPYERSGQGEEENNKYLFSAKKFLAQSLKEYHHITSILDKEYLYSIITFDKGKPVLEQIQSLLIICNELLAMVENFQKFSLSIGMSSNHLAFQELPEGYSEALSALSLNFYNDNHIALYEPKLDISDSAEMQRIRQIIDDIITGIQQGGIDDALKTLDKLFGKHSNNKINIEQIKISGLLLCSLCFRLIPNYMLELPENLQFESVIYKQIRESKSLQSLHSILSGVIESVSKLITSSNKQNNYLVIQVNRFIHDNYAGEINLQEIAKHVHVNSSYLSRLYGKITGESVVEALNKFRINKAKDLLLRSPLKISEIASAVGIEDPAYFTHVFVKYVGISPKEFKIKNISN